MMVDDVRSGADLVLAVGPPYVVRAGEAPVVAVSRVPSFGVAQICISIDKEKGHAAAALVRRVVGAWNPQNIQADVCAEVRRLAILAHASEPDVAVDHECWREGQS